MRTCDCCGMKPMNSGYVLGGGEEYYCTEACLEKTYTKEEIEEFDLGGDESESYWTEWNDDGIDEAECACCGKDLDSGYYVLIDAEPTYVCHTGCLRKLKLGKYNTSKVAFTIC